MGILGRGETIKRSGVVERWSRHGGRLTQQVIAFDADSRRITSTYCSALTSAFCTAAGTWKTWCVVVQRAKEEGSNSNPVASTACGTRLGGRPARSLREARLGRVEFLGRALRVLEERRDFSTYEPVTSSVDERITDIRGHEAGDGVFFLRAVERDGEATTPVQRHFPQCPVFLPVIPRRGGDDELANRSVLAVVAKFSLSWG